MDAGPVDQTTLCEVAFFDKKYKKTPLCEPSGMEK
jgi:hypothetical protein